MEQQLTGTYEKGGREDPHGESVQNVRKELTERGYIKQQMPGKEGERPSREQQECPGECKHELMERNE